MLAGALYGSTGGQGLLCDELSDKEQGSHAS